MDIRNTQLLERVLARYGRPEGHVIECHGTLTDRYDFVQFAVYPDRLQIALRRVLVEVGAFHFLFMLRPDGRQASIERIVRDVEGANRRIRAALGEPYAKTSIGVPFRDLSEEEEEWVEDALKTFFHYWMREPA